MNNIYYFIELLEKSLYISLLILFVYLFICLIYYVQLNYNNIKQYISFICGKCKKIRGTLYYKKFTSDSMKKLKYIPGSNTIDYNLYVNFIINSREYNIPVEQPIISASNKKFKRLSKRMINIERYYGEIVKIYYKNDDEIFCPTIFWMSFFNSFLDYLITSFIIASLIGIILFVVSIIFLILIII